MEIPESPQRIISFSPAITEALFLLGLGDRVVGVSAFCARPAEAAKKRKVGSYSTASPELLRELEPDVIFTVTGYQRRFAEEFAKQFPVYPFELPVSVAGILDTVVKLGLVLGEQEQGRRLYFELFRKIASTEPVRRRTVTYVEIDLGGPVSFGAYSYITDTLHLLGASNVFDQVRSEWLTPNLEDVLRRDPELFIYEPKMYTRFGDEQLEALIDARGWREMRAVKCGNYGLTPGPLDFLAHHGPSFVTDSIPWLRNSLKTASDRLA